MFYCVHPKPLHVTIGAVTRIEKLPERTVVRTQSKSRMEGVLDKDQKLGEGRVDWFQMESMHGAQPKWNRAGWPPMVPEEPRVLEAAEGVIGRDTEERVVTPPRREVN